MKRKSTGEKELFEQLIIERAVDGKIFSFVSGADISHLLSTSFAYNLFAHVIPKKGHNRLTFHSKEQRKKYLILNPENIVFLTPREHHLVDNGTEEQRKKHEEMNNMSFDKFYKLQEELIIKIQDEINNPL